jgi:hypothetical protein
MDSGPAVRFSKFNSKSPLELQIEHAGQVHVPRAVSAAHLLFIFLSLQLPGPGAYDLKRYTIGGKCIKQRSLKKFEKIVHLK